MAEIIDWNDVVIDDISARLQRNEVGIFPCDTIYGICAKVSEETRERIYEIKERPESKRLLVLKHYRPHTFFTDIELTGEGAMVAAVEEPLITAAFEKGKFIKGQREWRFGINLEMYVHPVRSGGEVIGVVLETVGEITVMWRSGWRVL